MSHRRNWDSPNPFAASECALPPGPKGVGAHPPAHKGVGEFQFRRWRKSLALCLLCGYNLSHISKLCAEEVHISQRPPWFQTSYLNDLNCNSMSNINASVCVFTIGITDMQMRERNMQKSANMQIIQSFCANGLTGPCKYCFNTELRGMTICTCFFASLMYLENQKTETKPLHL
jgi:hypothetical protein